MSTKTTASHAAMVRKETIANTVATAVIAAAVSWAIFRGSSSIPALSPPIGGIFGILPGTFNFTLLVTIALTLIIRRRVRRGILPRIAASERAHVGASLPDHILTRSVLLAALATVLFVPICVGIVWAATRARVLPLDWSFQGMLAFFVLYFVILSMAVTPVVVWRALGD